MSNFLLDALKPSLIKAAMIICAIFCSASAVNLYAQSAVVDSSIGNLNYKMDFGSSISNAGTFSIDTKAKKVEALIVESPLRLVVDVYGSFKGKSTSHTVNNSKLINSVRVGVHPDKIRFVIDIIEQPNFKLRYEIKPQALGSVISFSYQTDSDSIVSAQPEPTTAQLPASTLAPTVTSSPTATITAQASLTQVASPTVSPSPTFTLTPTKTATFSATTSVTITPEMTKTEIQATATFKPETTATKTSIPTNTVTPTNSKTATVTRTPSATRTATSTAAPSSTAVPSSTPVPSVTPMPAASHTQIVATIVPASTPSAEPTLTIPAAVAAALIMPIDITATPEVTQQETENQQIQSLSFDYQQPDNLPVVILNTKQRPAFKLIKRDDGTFILSVTDCSISNKSLSLPQFPPQDFLGFRFVQVSTKASSCEVLIGVDKGTRVAAFAKDNSILIRSIGFASN